MRTRMNKPALLISLLALGTLGLVGFGGEDDDQATAASETETTRDVLAAGNNDRNYCGYFGRYEFAVEGDVSCHRARRVLRHVRRPLPLPGSWSCGGGDSEWRCHNKAGATIEAWVTCSAWRHYRDHAGSCPEWIKRSEEQRHHEHQAG
jgi:hypothetical protein